MEAYHAACVVSFFLFFTVVVPHVWTIMKFRNHVNIPIISFFLRIMFFFVFWWVQAEKLIELLRQPRSTRISE